MNVMLDIETMGKSNAAVVSIGAVEFTLEGLGREFYEVISLESCLRKGLQVDGSTVMWWMQQSDEARSIQNGGDLRRVLTNLSSWMPEGAKVWGNGPAFDNQLVANLYRVCDMKLPWDFRNDRCYRTIKSLLPEMPVKRIGVEHRAVDDAKTQAAHLIKILSATTPWMAHRLIG